ncbi:cytochrome-c peroxidase [Roseomonas sp. WA12]
MRPHVRALAVAAAFFLGGAGDSAPEEFNRNGPILPVPAASGGSSPVELLGEALFSDPRLSGTGRTSCATCHDPASNGASARARDVSDRGGVQSFNTPTVFNVSYSFRLNWEGRISTLRALVEGTLRNPDLMGGSESIAVARLREDGATVARFRGVYGRPPDAAALVDALSAYVATLVTPDSPFDRWLNGDVDAIGAQEKRGYVLFRSVGCTACHQGVNVGANLQQRYGIFRPLTESGPPILRVPSLRNVGVTAPYFHDGSATSLAYAVRAMGLAQLDLMLETAEVSDIVAFLCSLTGRYRGEPLRSPAGSEDGCAAEPR